MSKDKKKFLKGSGVLVVIFAGLATSVYMISTFADYEHFNISLDKYKEKIKSIYDKKVEDIDKEYIYLEKKIENNKSYILE